MDVLGGLSILRSGIRMARNLIPDKAQSSGKAFAVTGSESPGTQLIGARDGDGDGQLTLSEFGASGRLFERLDRDGNGLLTATEIDEGVVEIHQSRRMERAISSYMELHDSDHDSVLNSAESGIENDVFGLIDINGDGFLNRGELTSGYRQQKVDISA